MARRALLVGINHYQSTSLPDLKGCRNDVENLRDVLKTYLGFTNNDIRALIDERATKANIMHRLNYMVSVSRPGDYLIFHFSGHGSQIRDRDGDELNDWMDELICPHDMDWEQQFITDDDLNDVFKNIPPGADLEVTLDCCHSGWDEASALYRSARSPAPSGEAHLKPAEVMPRYLPPPRDIVYRHEGEEAYLMPSRSFTADTRSTSGHVIWTACRPDEDASDTLIGGNYHGAFTYYFCSHLRETRASLTRHQLLMRVQDSLRYNRYPQVPTLFCGNSAMRDKRPYQFPAMPETERLLFLASPFLRGDDVKAVQNALKQHGFDIDADGVFGPYTRIIVIKFQERNNLPVDGIVGPAVRKKLFDL